MKKRKHGISACIRNNLLAQYFPELDHHFGPLETLSVVRECLDPSAIAGMEYDTFCRTVAPGRGNLEDSGQFHWRHHGRSGIFEAQVMVDSLRQL